MSITPQRFRVGISMIEVVVSTLLVSTILIVSLNASSNLLRNRLTSSESVEGQLLARRYLDEITSLGFMDHDANVVFGAESDESTSDRMTLDDVDDYHGLVLAPPTSRSGNAITGYTGWTVAVSVSPADSTASGFVLSADQSLPLRQIVASCTSPLGGVYTASGFVSQSPSTLDPSLLHQRRRAILMVFPSGQNLEMELPLRNQPSGSGS